MRYAFVLLAVASLASPIVALAKEAANSAPIAESKILKAQESITALNDLQAAAYKATTAFYLQCLGKTPELKKEYQEALRSSNGLFTRQADAQLLSLWQLMTLAMGDGLTNEGLPTDANIRRIDKSLQKLAENIDKRIAELRSDANLPPRSMSERLVDTYKDFSDLTTGTLLNTREEAELQQLLSRVDSQLGLLGNFYKDGEPGKELREISRKWPLLKDALQKAQAKKDVSFLISRYAPQIGEHLLNAYADTKNAGSNR